MILLLVSFLHPFLFIENKRLFISSEGFSTLEKNALICNQKAMLPVESSDRPLQIVIAVWCLFCLNSNFLVGCDSPLLTIMVHQKAITICRGLSHPTRSLSRIVCRGQERPKGRKGTLRLDFQANTSPGIFVKSQCHHKIQEDSCEEFQV